MKKILAICDQERAYASRMMEYLSDRKNFPFQVEAFTSVDSLAAYTARHPVEILLISERSYSEQVEDLKIEKIIVLSEEDREGPAAGFEKKFPNSVETIYKYQPSSEVVRETMDCYRVVTRLPAADAPGKISKIGIFSPCQAPDTTLFSLILGQELAKSGNVLYLNMKPFSGLTELLHKEENSVKESSSFSRWEKRTGRMNKDEDDLSTLDDLLYCCRQDTGGFNEQLFRMLRSFRGLDCLPEAISPTDLAMVEGEEWQKFFRAIEETGRWDFLLLELGEGIQDMEEIMGSCSYVVLPFIPGILAEARMKEFRRQNFCPDGIEVCLPELRQENNADAFGTAGTDKLLSAVREVLAGLKKYSRPEG
ncbi:MAG: hypothetical protein U0L49_02360 [Eubacterium sp.]|nr:hypothetical protein [Eubacterium sp.]